MRQATSLVLAVLFAVFCVEGVRACGDKLLLASRDFAYSRTYAAIHPAMILIYLPKAANSHGAGSGLASVLKRAGHDAEVVSDVPGMTNRLRSDEVDVVLADIVNMPKVEAASVECSAPPVFVPVLFDASAAALVAAKTHYPFALKAPETANEFLKTIDQAMGSRQSHVTKKHRH